MEPFCFIFIDRTLRLISAGFSFLSNHFKSHESLFTWPSRHWVFECVTEKEEDSRCRREKKKLVNTTKSKRESSHCRRRGSSSFRAVAVE